MSDNDHRGPSAGDDDLTLPKATVQKLIAGESRPALRARAAALARGSSS